jgi:hypothetical protein
MFAHLTSPRWLDDTEITRIDRGSSAVRLCRISLAQSAATRPTAKAKYGTWGVDLTARDSSVRPDAIRQRLLTDPHSPPNSVSTASSATSTRGTGRSTSSPATSSIYLAPEQRVHIW